MPVYKFTDGRKGWYFSLSFNGKRYKKEKYNGKPMLTKVEAQSCEADYRRHLEQEKVKSQLDEKYKVTVLEAWDLYVDNKMLTLKPSTIAKYTTFKKCYLPCKELTLSQLEIYHIDQWKSQVKNDGCVTSSKNKKMAILDDFLDYCTLHYDLTNKLRIPLATKFKDNNPPKKVNYYTLEQFELYYSVIDNDFFKTLFRCLFYGGFRIGELLAMQIEDFKGNGLYVSKTLSRIGGKEVTMPPKTKNSYRLVLLDEITCQMLKELIGERKKGYIFGDKEAVSQQHIRRKMLSTLKPQTLLN